MAQAQTTDLAQARVPPTRPPRTNEGMYLLCNYKRSTHIHAKFQQNMKDRTCVLAQTIKKCAPKGVMRERL